METGTVSGKPPMPSAAAGIRTRSGYAPERAPVASFRRLARIQVAAVVLAALFSGCSSIRERKPVPEELVEVATIPGVRYARIWGDVAPPDLEERAKEVRARAEAASPDVKTRPRNFLAISGGGSNGAFGAGLLSGWTETGK